MNLTKKKLVMYYYSKKIENFNPQKNEFYMKKKKIQFL